MSSSMINRALSNIRTEIDFLRESKVISDDVYRQIDQLLPQKYDPNSVGSGNSTPVGYPQPQSRDNNQGVLEYVEAIYDFEPQQEGDLRLRVGDKIQVLEKPSPEWYKGRSNGVVGMFPSNYVKVIAGPERDYSQQQQQALPPPPMYSSDSTQGSKHSLFHNQQPPPPQPQLQPQPQPQPQQPVYYQPPANAPQQIIVQQEQPNKSKHEGLKRFGKQLGNAAIFGAGATIGSDLVNSIF